MAKFFEKYTNRWAAVVAQLVERSFSTPENRGLDPVFGKIYMYYHQLYWKDENEEKDDDNGPI